MSISYGGTAQGLDWEVIHPFLDGDLIPLVEGDGRFRVAVLPRAVGPHGVWPCACCEQWHRNEVNSCPLANGPTKQVYMGPIKTEEGEFYVTGLAPDQPQGETDG